MCNLYSMTTTQEAIRRLFAIDRDLTGNLPPRDRPRLALVLHDAGSMLMHADNRSVDHLDSGIMSSSERIFDTAPDPSPPPANEAV